MTKQQETYRNFYLKSAHWKETRTKALAHYGSVCATCGKTGFDVHHKTYRNLGREVLSDLAILCRKHHRMVHTDEDGKHTTAKRYIENVRTVRHIKKKAKKVRAIKTPKEKRLKSPVNPFRSRAYGLTATTPLHSMASARE